jgi:hypothetical protein
MQPGFYRSYRNANKLMNFFQFIAFCVMQQHDNPMFVTELREGRIELPQLVQTLLVPFRVIGAGKPRQAVAGKKPLLDGLQAATRKAPLLVDKQVVHNAAQPRARLVDVDQVIEFAERLDQEFLEQVFGLGLAPGQAERESVQPVEMRPDQGVEGLCAVVDRWSPWLTAFRS